MRVYWPVGKMLTSTFLLTFLALIVPNESKNEVVASFKWHFRDPLGPWIHFPDSAELIKSRGYPVEQHKVTTEDGFILRMFRIPHGRNEKGKNPRVKRPPVIVNHGFLCSGDCWTIMSPENGIVYRLADAGYDVWITNNRGPPYSKNHKKLSPKDAKYWDYSIHELGLYDVPAFIDYILKTTKFQKLTYIGHSQGTAQYFVMASTRPEYNKKINVMVALGPIAYLDDTKGVVKTISKYSPLLKFISNVFGVNKILEHPIWVTIGNLILCKPNSIFRNMCNKVFFSITGYDEDEFDLRVAYDIPKYSPTAASMKTLRHYSQLIRSGRFQMYDYGETENLKRYKSKTPPEYDLSKISSPIILYHANNDYISTPSEVIKLAGKLPNLVKRVEIKLKNFNHMDFMWAKDSNKYLNNDVIKDIAKFQKI